MVIKTVYETVRVFQTNNKQQLYAVPKQEVCSSTFVVVTLSCQDNILGIEGGSYLISSQDCLVCVVQPASLLYESTKNTCLVDM